MPTILITGANRGLGLEFVRQYAAQGWEVLATVRDPLAGRAASDAGAKVFVADMADEGSIARLKASLAGVGLDIVLANAGVYGDKQGFGAVDAAEFHKVITTNVLGPLKLAEALADQMAGQKVFAALSSLMGSVAENSSGGFYAYRASKAALNMVIKNLSLDLKDRGITVLALSPGWVRTDMGGANAPLSPEQAIAGMRTVLDGADLSQTGKFIHYDGRELPW